MTELETAPAPGSESDRGGRRPVVISDPQAIRALAHEARLEARLMDSAGPAFSGVAGNADTVGQ